jgi:hypothetical protein
VRQTLYKNPPLILRLRQRDGMIHAYQLLPDVAAGGFLLSPAISDPSQFMMLYGPGMMDQLGDETVVELQVGGENPASLDGIFDPQYSIELFRLEYPTRDISGVPGVSDYLQLRNTLHSATTVYSDAPLGIYTMDPGIHAIVAVRRSQILLPIPAGTGAVQIPLGIVRQGDAGGEPSGGCEMKIYAVQRDGRGGFNGQLLLSRTFAPQHILADSAPVTVTAQLPPGQLDGILLETSPTRAGATVVSYWGLPLFIPNEKKSPQRE